MAYCVLGRLGPAGAHPRVRRARFVCMDKRYPLHEAVQAQKALRAAAGLGPEQFPIEAFVGMISDEIEALRTAGKSDEEIAALVRENSAIELNAEEIAQNYASPEERGRHGA